MTLLERLINVALIIGLGLTGGYFIGIYQKAKLIQSCPIEKGHTAVQQTIRKDGTYTCIYTRTTPGMVGYVKEIRK